jgi:hypothetical protein
LFGHLKVVFIQMLSFRLTAYAGVLPKVQVKRGLCAFALQFCQTLVQATPLVKKPLPPSNSIAPYLPFIKNLITNER